MNTVRKTLAGSLAAEFNRDSLTQIMDAALVFGKTAKAAATSDYHAKVTTLTEAKAAMDDAGKFDRLAWAIADIIALQAKA